MNFGLVLNYLGKLLLLNSACMIPSLLLSFGDSDKSLFAFLLSIGIQIIIAVLFSFVKPKNKLMYSKEGFVIVAFGWILISAFGALPLYFSGYFPKYIDALFESVSGFTTTGATVCTDIEIISKSVLFWRSFTHWLGGMGVLVLLLAIAPNEKSNGMPLHILRAESPGPSVSKLAPKLSLTARIMYYLYIVLTLLEIVFLLFGGMPIFDSVVTSFATAGTGGFSIKNASLGFYSEYCQTVAAIFMLLFGVNFSMYFLIAIGQFKSVIKNTELRVYLSIIAVATFLVTLFTKNDFSSIGNSIHHSFFQVVSIITTTGFVTVDFNLWHPFTHCVLFLLMIIGACAGSTGGGMKVSRIVLYYKYVKTEIKKLLHPHAVVVPTLDGNKIEISVMNRAIAYFVLYFVIAAASVSIVSFNGFDFKTSFAATMSCFNNIGPCLGKIGPYDNFSGFSVISKSVLILDMLFGRLEIFPLVIMLSPSTWRR